MSTVRFVWSLLPPLGKVIAIAVPVLFLAGVIAALVTGGRP